MVRVRLAGLCMRQAAVDKAVGFRRVPSPSHHYSRKTNSLTRHHENTGVFNMEGAFSFKYNRNGNRVMVVVDSSVEANGSLQWALSHAVQAEDTIILLHVVKSNNTGGNSNLENERASDVLQSMKNLCAERRPGVNVEVALEEGKDKGFVIVETAKRLKVSLLVLGLRKRSRMWRLRMLWGRNRSQARLVDYCIQNANCVTIGVRKRSNKYGGYLITTKCHKKFWLLA